MGTRVDAFGVLKRSLLRFGVFLLLESGVVYAISWPRARYTGTLRQHRPFFGAQSLWLFGSICNLQRSSPWLGCRHRLRCLHGVDDTLFSFSSHLISTRLDLTRLDSTRLNSSSSPHLISFSSCLGSTRLVSLGHTAVCLFALRWLCHSPRSIVSFMDRDCNTVLDIQFYRIYLLVGSAPGVHLFVSGSRCVLTLGASSFSFVVSQRFSFMLALSVDSFVFD